MTKSSHTVKLRVRYDECDPMGLVHHSNYFKYFEITRIDLFRASGGSYLEFEASGLFVVVAKAECIFKMPAKYDDELEIEVTVKKQTEAKIIQSYFVHRGDDLLVEATITLAVIDLQGIPQRIPQCLRVSE